MLRLYNSDNSLFQSAQVRAPRPTRPIPPFSDRPRPAPTVRRTPIATASILVCASAVWLLSACSQGGAAKEEKEVEAGLHRRETPRVRVASVVERPMSRVLETTAVLESEREIQIVPLVGGTVVEVKAEEGDRVRAGQELCVLDERDLELAARDAEAALEEARQNVARNKLLVEETEVRQATAKLASEQAARDYERDIKLHEGGAVPSALSQRALEASKLARDNARVEEQQAEIALRKARLEAEAASTATTRVQLASERAQLALSHARVTAPFDGVVATRLVRVGDSAGPPQPVFVLTEVSGLRAIFYRPQEELELFSRQGVEGAVGLALRATAEAWPGRAFLGSIERISPTIDAQSGQFRVTARLKTTSEDGAARLLPGMLVRLRIVTETHERALVVPKRALQREGEARFVWLVRDLALCRVDVHEGLTEDEFLEVLPSGTEAISHGEQVVVVGSRDLAQGLVVEIDAARDAAAAEPDRTADGAGTPDTTTTEARNEGAADDSYDARPLSEEAATDR
jgi:membrane fusion protein (multidrug efflux system)